MAAYMLETAFRKRISPPDKTDLPSRDPKSSQSPNSRFVWEYIYTPPDLDDLAELGKPHEFMMYRGGVPVNRSAPRIVVLRYTILPVRRHPGYNVPRNA